MTPHHVLDVHMHVEELTLLQVEPPLWYSLRYPHVMLLHAPLPHSVALTELYVCCECSAGLE